MLAKPKVVVAWKEELIVDVHGQRWAPGCVTLEWPGHNGISGPSVSVKVVALAREGMTEDELEAEHVQAVRDVLTAATLAIEEPIYAALITPPSRTCSDPTSSS